MYVRRTEEGSRKWPITTRKIAKAFALSIHCIRRVGMQDLLEKPLDHDIKFDYPHCSAMRDNIAIA